MVHLGLNSINFSQLKTLKTKKGQGRPPRFGHIPLRQSSENASKSWNFAGFKQRPLAF